MNIQSGQSYIGLGGTLAPYLIYDVGAIWNWHGHLMAEYTETPLSGGMDRGYSWSLVNIQANVLEPLTPETLIKYTTLQDMCWSGLTHNMALDLWNKGYRKV